MPELPERMLKMLAIIGHTTNFVEQVVRTDLVYEEMAFQNALIERYNNLHEMADRKLIWWEKDKTQMHGGAWRITARGEQTVKEQAGP
jgi:hypothetical protein